jgi:uncharacterized protein
MKLYVLVKPGARKDDVVKMPDKSLKIFVKAKPIKGKANESVKFMLSEYYGVPKSSITLLSGETSKHKYFEILE